MTFKVISTLYFFLSHSFNHLKMVDVYNYDVDAIPSPFSHAQEWFMTGKHS
jgi:hypothetical protein